MSLFLPTLYRWLSVVIEGGLAGNGTIPGSLWPWVGGGIALLAALAGTPLVIRVARWKGWVAWPRHDRWHTRPVALMGGIALFGAVGIGIVSTGALTAYAGPVWVGILLVFAGGLADDLWDTRPETKLVVQILATALLLYADYAFWRGGPFWISIPLTFLWVIGITNALNLLDGLDGLAGGITAVAATVLALMGAAVGQWPLAVVAATLVGASLGFLVYNAKPARIFMGDCGSLLLGYVLAVTALEVQSSGGPVAGTLAPIVVMAVPIFDTTFVTVTRILEGRPITEGSTDHTHHRLVRLGLSESEAVIALCSISAVFGGAALMVLWSTAQLFLALVLLGMVAATVFGLYLVGSASYEPASRMSRSATARFGAVMRALAGGVYWKSVAGVVADLLVVVAAFILAFHLRFGGAPPADQAMLMVRALPGLVVIKVVVFYTFGLYHGIWRYAGTPEVVRLIKASTVASVLVGGGMVVLFGSDDLSIAVLVLDWMVATGVLGGTRFGFRILRQYFAARQGGTRQTLVYGSGPQVMLLLRHLRQHPDRGRTVMGLLDDRPARQGLRVQGIDVLGASSDLPQICAEHDVDEVIVPVKATTETERKRIRDRCAQLNVACQFFAFGFRPAAEQEQVRPSTSGDGEVSPEPL